MQSDRSHASATPSLGSSASPRRSFRAILPGVVLGAGLWLMPGESFAAPRCASKPAVCSRLEAEQRQRAQLRATEAKTPLRAQANAATAMRDARPRCITKPVVCARFAPRAGAPELPPVTLAQSANGSRCTSKPVICARQRMRPNAPPTIVARDDWR
jgi:hypothetical protein